MIKVMQFLRHPSSRAYSVERLYQDVRAFIPNDIYIETRFNCFPSKGILGRIFDMLSAALVQRDVNHVTGDVHYLTYLLRRKRTILTVLDCVGLERSKGIKFWILWFLWYWLPEKCCTIIVVISESTRHQLISYLACNPDKIKVIYCTISPEFSFHPKSFNNSCPVILHIGSTINKNLERHAPALEGLTCKLLIIGRLSEAQTRSLEKYEIQYENLFDLSSADLVEQYKRCDILLFASTYEGFGLPIVEAQAIGRPVVTSNIWSMPEIAGDGACLVDPFDVDSIRYGVKQIIDDPEYRENLIRKGLKNVGRFHPEMISAQYAELYREVYRSLKKMAHN